MNDKIFKPITHLSRPLVAVAGLFLLFALTGELGKSLQAQEEVDLLPSIAGAASDLERLERYGSLVSTEADLEKVEDPVTLREVGEYHLSRMNKALARKCFEASVSRDEINHFTPFAKTPFGEAAVLELMGDWESSRATWRKMFVHNVMDSLFFMAHYSVDPKKDLLLEEAKTHLDSVIKAAKAGEDALIYTTKKGASRYLKVTSSEDALKAFDEGKRLRYVYIDEMDVSGRVFEKGVGCSRCVVGSIKGFGSNFKEQFDFRGIVLGDVHFGKRWLGEINKSASEPASTFNRFYLDQAVVLGKLNLDSVQFQGRVASMPFSMIKGEVNMRNANFQANAEFRFTYFGDKVDAKGAEFHQSNYFGHTHFGGGLDFSRVVVHRFPLYFNSSEFEGPMLFEKCELHRGATFEDSKFDAVATMRQCRIYDRLNLSRATFSKGLVFSQIQATDLEFLGTELTGGANFSDCVFSGNVRFALDGLTRRLHLDDVTPLHKLYKQYQGDDDADADLTSGSQYGVISVDDLTAKLRGNVSFANTIFQKFVNFEGVQFGTEGQGHLASFFNTQFYGEAHFERTNFFAMADFRTIFGNEVSFNNAHFHRTFMLDDANVPGRLSMSGAEMSDGATVSFYGARIASFGITWDQLVDDSNGGHRLFHESCALSDDIIGVVDDPRLFDARWDSENERLITDEDAVKKRAERLCLERSIQEFVVLKDSFGKRGMGDENDWAFWHMRHYKNRSLLKSDRAPTVIFGALEWLLFEKGFGWGVRLSNLLGTGLVVVLIFVVMLRLFCSKMEVDWDTTTVAFKDLPYYAMFIVSFHIFLGRARDWKSKVSPRAYKFLYTAEMIIGIIIITFFIGAYTRLVLR